MSPRGTGDRDVLADQLQQRCRDQAQAYIALVSTDPALGSALEKHRDAVICGIEAGIDGTLDALADLGLLPGRTA